MFCKIPVEEWLNLKNFFQCRLLCHECKADKDTCVGPYMLKGIPWMSSSMKVSNLEKFVLGLTFD